MIVVLHDMNAWVGNLEVKGKIGKFSVHLVQFWTKAGLFAANAWFKKQRINEHNLLIDNGTDEALIHWMLVDMRIKSICAGEEWEIVTS